MKYLCEINVIIFAVLICTCHGGEPDKQNTNSSGTLALRMADYAPVKNDDYHCVDFEVSSEKKKFITKFQVDGTADRAHHMILYGCSQTSNSSPSGWDCGHHAVCSGSQTILFAWAKNAPPTSLPPSVGFQIGGDTNVNYLVLQIHYAHTLPEGELDRSGMDLDVTTEEQKFMAGIFLLGTSHADIPPFRSETVSDVSCRVYAANTLHFFAFRTHAHALGKVISGYKIAKGTEKVEEIAKGNPQWPQAFYKMSKIFDVNDGDILLARCTFDSTNRNRTTRIGTTAADEMCNLYILYYTEAKNGKSFSSCWDEDSRLKASRYFPADSVKPLPPNPLLEEHALHGDAHKNHASPVMSISNQTGSLEQVVDYGALFKSESPLGVPEKKSHSYSDSHIHRKPGVSQDSVLYENSDTLHDSKPLIKQNFVTVPDDYISDAQWNFSIKYQPSGVAVDSKGNVIVFHRSNRAWDGDTFDANHILVAGREGIIKQNTLMLLDPSNGHVVQEAGSNMFYLPHGVTVDSHDQLWVTDVGAHQIFKLSPLKANSNQLEVLLQLGEKLQPGSGDYQFCKPASVAVLPDGDFFVADGYCNSRIIRFNKAGVKMYQFGDDMSNSPSFSNLSPQAMYVVHSLAIVPEEELICAADRENGRILCFSLQSGNLEKVIIDKEFQSTIYAIAHSGGYMYAVNGPTETLDGTVFPLGFIIDMKGRGQIVGHFGTRLSTHMDIPHALTLSPNATSIYIAQLGRNKVEKLTRESGVKLNTLAATTSNKDGNPKDSTKFEIPTFSTSLVVLSILALPLLLIIAVFSIMKLRKRGHFGRKDRSQPSDLGSLLGHRDPSRGGFEKLAMEDSEEGELDSDSDTDVVEFTKATSDISSKA